ncbi:MAG: nuclear transport factor 2 family protein [Pseudomonadota bacterium]
MTPEDEVRAASETFYAALNTMLGGDASALSDIWSHSETVTTLHPIGRREVGWEAVRDSFEEVARGSTGGHVEASDRVICVIGDVAYEVGVEKAQFAVADTPLTVNSRFTNIYQRENGTWKIVHHHGDKSPGINEALQSVATK